MIIEKLTLKNFRNIKDCSLDTSAKHVILTGENGQGKTNLLEAVYMLCYGTSFRTQNIREIVNYSASAFYTGAEYEDAVGIPGSVSVSFDTSKPEESKKKILVNGKEIRDRKELIYNIPCIVFSHDDMEIVRGEPENRRRFFDQTMTMYDPGFFDTLRRYRQTLRQRNAALKAGRLELLDIYDTRLARYGLEVMNCRNMACASFGAVFPDLYGAVSQDGRNLKITYRPSWGHGLSEEQVLQKLKEQRSTDMKMFTTTSGPHRDRFIITDGSTGFAEGASTGQTRLASLVFRSAQAAFYRMQTGLDPILLIDDVLLELDPVKRARFLSYLGNYSQAFFTFLPDEKYFDSLFEKEAEETKYYTVTGGRFYEKD